jgi:hypothetical protein
MVYGLRSNLESRAMQYCIQPPSCQYRRDGVEREEGTINGRDFTR